MIPALFLRPETLRRDRSPLRVLWSGLATGGTNRGARRRPDIRMDTAGGSFPAGAESEAPAWDVPSFWRR